MSRLGTGAPDDGHDVAAIQVAETGEGQGELLPLGPATKFCVAGR